MIPPCISLCSNIFVQSFRTRINAIVSAREKEADEKTVVPSSRSRARQPIEGSPSRVGSPTTRAPPSPPLSSSRSDSCPKSVVSKPSAQSSGQSSPHSVSPSLSEVEVPVGQQLRPPSSSRQRRNKLQLALAFSESLQVAAGVDESVDSVPKVARESVVVVSANPQASHNALPLRLSKKSRITAAATAATSKKSFVKSTMQIPASPSRRPDVGLDESLGVTDYSALGISVAGEGGRMDDSDLSSLRAEYEAAIAVYNMQHSINAVSVLKSGGLKNKGTEAFDAASSHTRAPSSCMIRTTNRSDAAVETTDFGGSPVVLQVSRQPWESVCSPKPKGSPEALAHSPSNVENMRPSSAASSRQAASPGAGWSENIEAVTIPFVRVRQAECRGRPVASEIRGFRKFRVRKAWSEKKAEI